MPDTQSWQYFFPDFKHPVSID